MESPAHETSTSAFTSASSRPGGVAQVHNLLDRLELRLQLSQWLNLALAGALVLSAGAATWTMAAAGHQGAKLAWCEETHNCPKGGGEGGEGNEEEEGAPAPAPELPASVNG